MARDHRGRLDELPGVPELMVCDGAGTISSAAAIKWPQVTRCTNWPTAAAEPFVFRCEYHLPANALERIKRLCLASEQEVLEKTAFKPFPTPRRVDRMNRFRENGNFVRTRGIHSGRNATWC